MEIQMKIIEMITSVLISTVLLRLPCDNSFSNTSAAVKPAKRQFIRLVAPTQVACRQSLRFLQAWSTRITKNFELMGSRSF